MIKKKKIPMFCVVLLLLLALTMGGCGSSDGEITELAQLDGQVFAVPTGTAADQLVLSKIPNAQFQY
jgi:polar amino acid transport system substrate-binding protein